MPSRTTTMSIDGLPPSGVFTPGNSRTGRRFTWWSSSKRSRSSRPRSSTPGGTLGSPTAPSRIASCPRSSLITESGISSPVRCQRAAPRSYVVVSTSDTTSRRTLRPSATTSGPMPSPGITASLMTSKAIRPAVAVGARAGLQVSVAAGITRAPPAHSVSRSAPRTSVGTDRGADPGQHLGRHRAVHGDHHQRLAAAPGAADLRRRRCSRPRRRAGRRPRRPRPGRSV